MVDLQAILSISASMAALLAVAHAAIGVVPRGDTMPQRAVAGQFTVDAETPDESLARLKAELTRQPQPGEEGGPWRRPGGDRANRRREAAAVVHQGVDPLDDVSFPDATLPRYPAPNPGMGGIRPDLTPGEQAWMLRVWLRAGQGRRAPRAMDIARAPEGLRA